MSLITGEEGLFARANHVAKLYENVTKEEKSKVDEIMDELNSYTGLPELPKTETEFTNRANGVIDIVWLDTNNNVIEEPLSPKDHLGELTAVKYSGNAWEPADENNILNDWYKYEAQTGETTEGGTSNWANAKIEKEGKTAYFVWIPRYAYKITYFDTADNANAYRTNGSTEGIVGYSTIQGIIDATGDEAKIVEGTEPTNVTGRVRTSKYAEYIPHPAFEFDGAKEGIWVGKYEPSGITNGSGSDAVITSIEIKENEPIIRNITVDAAFTGSKEMKGTYGLSGDTHMMKNIEWGAVAYLTESKYGRNGTEVTQNTDSNWITGGGDYIANKLQSSTGNVYGIYDLSGGTHEYVAGYVENESAKNSRYISSLIKADIKYKDVYLAGTTDSKTDNYQANRGMKGDAVYETSTGSDTTSGWHGDWSEFPFANFPIFIRGGHSGSIETRGGVFYFNCAASYMSSGIQGFRVVLVS